jgi:hypothetical protein
VEDFVAIPLYAAFEVWNILVAGAAGPVAVAVGVRMTGLHAPSPATGVAYGATVIALLSISLLGTMSKVFSFGKLIPGPKRLQKHMVSRRMTQRGSVTKVLLR